VNEMFFLSTLLLALCLTLVVRSRREQEKSRRAWKRHIANL
jgi:preprotein translocase subunit SecG